MYLTTRLDGRAFDEAAGELVQHLSSLREWFAQHGPDRWVRELDRDLGLLRRCDAYGLDRFASHFGSMGSVGDVGVGEVDALLGRAHVIAPVLRLSLDR